MAENSNAVQFNQAWIDQLIKEQYNHVYAYIKSHVSSTDDAEDLTQEVFLNAHKYSANFDPAKASPVTWLFVIARRKLIDFYRTRKDTVSLDDMEYDMLRGDDDIEKAADMTELRQELKEALEQLDERSRDILILKYFRDMPSAEIAERLDLTVNNVDVITHRALKKLSGIIKR